LHYKVNVKLNVLSYVRVDVQIHFIHFNANEKNRCTFALINASI